MNQLSQSPYQKSLSHGGGSTVGHDNNKSAKNTNVMSPNSTSSLNRSGAPKEQDIYKGGVSGGNIKNNNPRNSVESAINDDSPPP